MGVKANRHKTRGHETRACVFKTMETTISMRNSYVFFLPETYIGLLFHKFVGGTTSFS
jgi:hypothetical protein